MLKTPALLTSSSIEDERLKFEEWLIHIFEQPLEKAYRRNRELHGKWYIERRFKLDRKANKKAIYNLKKVWLKKAYKHFLRRIKKESI